MRNFAYLKDDIEVHGCQLKKLDVGIIEEVENRVATIHFINHDITHSLDLLDLEFFDPSETGDQFQNKICNRCHQYLPTEEFQKNQTGKNNRVVRRPSCVTCRLDINGSNIPSKEKKMWKETKPHHVLFKCPICEKTTIPGLTSKVVLDHDHDSGSVRGWICDSCNTGLGRFHDDLGILKRATDYLRFK